MQNNFSVRLISWLHFLRRVNFGLGSFIVSTQGYADTLPQIQNNPEYTFIPMDLENSEDTQTWLNVFNDAFERNWDEVHFEKYVLNHPVINVSDTLFLRNLQGEVMGVTSFGVFRHNPSIGVGHYIAIRKKFQGQQLGYYISMKRYHVLAQLGLKTFESETTIDRKRSIFMHFKLGFQSKRSLDHWNTRNLATRIFQPLINKKLDNYYSEWQLSLTSSN